ncbi:hypothetical protein RAN7_0636 [plant metagenome]|uniref:Uncharacterized protein n=1 Tax=plant metagenome TaxID=1297885 RepID=A0A484Y4H1_9ZZZZ
MAREADWISSNMADDLYQDGRVEGGRWSAQGAPDMLGRPT